MLDWFSLAFYPGVLFVVPFLIYHAWRFSVLLWCIVLGFAVPLFSFYPMTLMVVISIIYEIVSKFKKDSDGSLKMKFVGVIAEMWCIIARVYHGYEVHGLDRIPNGGALIVYYHGMVPLDIGYVSSYFVKFRGQVLEGIIDRTAFRIPGMYLMAKIMGATCNGREYCTQRLKEGHYMSVSPGGSYEMMFSSNYKVEWKNRIGFAKLAKDSGKPIIPMFTENIRQYADMMTFGQRGWIEKLYQKFRFPIYFAFGGYPVKLRTYLGEALYCGPEESAEEFAGRVKKSIEDLIAIRQKLPGSLVRALAARFT